MNPALASLPEAMGSVDSAQKKLKSWNKVLCKPQGGYTCVIESAQAFGSSTSTTLRQLDPTRYRIHAFGSKSQIVDPTRYQEDWAPGGEVIKH